MYTSTTPDPIFMALEPGFASLDDFPLATFAGDWFAVSNLNISWSLLVLTTQDMCIGPVSAAHFRSG